VLTLLNIKEMVECINQSTLQFCDDSWIRIQQFCDDSWIRIQDLNSTPLYIYWLYAFFIKKDIAVTCFA